MSVDDRAVFLATSIRVFEILDVEVVMAPLKAALEVAKERYRGEVREAKVALEAIEAKFGHLFPM